MTAPATTPDPEGSEPLARDALDLSRRDARTRTRLREVEAERDELRQQLAERDGAAALKIARLEHAEVSRLVSASFADVRDFFELADLDAIYDDDGNLAPALITAAAEAVLSERPHLRRDTTPPVRSVRELLNGADGSTRIPAPKSDPVRSAFRPPSKRGDASA